VRLIEQLSQILETRPELDLQERLVLKVAISWLDQRDYWALVEQDPGYDPESFERPKYRWEDHPWRVRLTLDEFEQLGPNQFGTVELIDGQPAGK
jgi:hypothetical protein